MGWVGGSLIGLVSFGLFGLDWVRLGWVGASLIGVVWFGLAVFVLLGFRADGFGLIVFRLLWRFLTQRCWFLFSLVWFGLGPDPAFEYDSTYCCQARLNSVNSVFVLCSSGGGY